MSSDFDASETVLLDNLRDMSPDRLEAVLQKAYSSMNQRRKQIMKNIGPQRTTNATIPQNETQWNERMEEIYVMICNKLFPSDDHRHHGSPGNNPSTGTPSLQEVTLTVENLTPDPVKAKFWEKHLLTKPKYRSMILRAVFNNIKYR